MYLKTVQKLWGEERWVVNNELYCEKILIINPRRCSSLHYHPIKDETWIVQSGILHAEIEGKRMTLCEGETIRIFPRQRHKFFNVDRVADVVLREVSTQHKDSDVVRLEESKII